MESDVKRAVIIFKAFCDENRIRILQLLLHSAINFLSPIQFEKIFTLICILFTFFCPTY